MNNSSTLIITGMHRSGTSLTASLLQSAGVNIGQELMSASQGNAKGYFENLDFVDFHEQVLIAQGFAKEGWTLNKDITVPENYLEKARQLIQNNQNDSVWGWKDPRTTLFLSFWSKWLPDAKYIFIFRSPWEVVDSLFRRGNSGDEIFTHNPNLALELWQSYNQIALDFYNNYPEKCVLLHLNTITENPKILTQIIEQKFQMKLGNCAYLFEQSYLNRAVDFHRLVLLKRYFPQAIELYLTLNQSADLYYQDEQLDALLSAKIDSYLNQKAWVLQDWLNIRKSEKIVKQLQSQLQQTQTELEQARTQLQQTQVELNQSCIKLQETQIELNQSHVQLQETQIELNQSYIQLQETQAELNQSYIQLQETQTELNQSHVNLQQIQTELNQFHFELQHTHKELNQSYIKLHQTQSELNESHLKLYQAQLETQESQTQLHITQAELRHISAQYQLTQDELDRSQTQLEFTQDELVRSQTQLEFTQDELVRSQTQLEFTQNELVRSQTQLEFTQDELDRSQTQLELTWTKLQKSQAQLQQMQTELQKSQLQLERTQTAFEQISVQSKPKQLELHQSQTQLQDLQKAYQKVCGQLEQAKILITAMESSKFWKLRSLWLKVKGKFGLLEEQMSQKQVDDFLEPIVPLYLPESALFVKENEGLDEDYKFTEISPTDDLVGHLDLPTNKERNQTGLLLVSGWVFSKNDRIQTLLIEKEDLSKEQITYGLLRPDVSSQYPEISEAQMSGFQWQIALGDNFTGLIEIRISAILEKTQQEICCFKRQVTLESNGSQTVSKAPNDENLVFIGNPHTVHAWQEQDFYQRWRSNNHLTAKLLLQMKDDAIRLQLNKGVKISLIVPVYNTPKKFLLEMLRSVLAQTYSNWELCIADDASEDIHVKTMLKEFMAADSRIKVIFRAENGHIVKATNSALDLATGDYIALLDHDDTLSLDALQHIAECIAKNPNLDWIYTDEDKIDPDGNHYDPQMKGQWSPEMALTHNYTHHLAVFRRSLVEQVGRMREGYEGAQDLDLFLRISEQTTADRIEHIAQVCYHWRSHLDSTASCGGQKQYVFDNAYRSIVEALERRGLKAKPFLPAIAKQYAMCLHQLRWEPSLQQEHLVTIIIPTKDRADLLKRCITSLEKTVNPASVKLLIIDDSSTEVATQDYFNELQQQQFWSCQVVSSNRQNEPFNYARLMNLAINYVDTPYILHLNNDVEAIFTGWLEDMIGWMSIAGVGVVGARLLYPNQAIQHGGVVIGSHDGLADHLFHNLPIEAVGYLALPHAARNVSAVTGACLLTSTELYRELQGFDEERFGVQYNDVDYCLKAIQSGRRVVYTPQATLIHQTSASRGQDYNFEEHLNFLNLYPDFRDPFFSPNLNIDSMLMEIDPHYFCHTQRAKNLKILLITHNLNLEGAPLMLYELAKYCVHSENYQVHLISPQDGILRQRLEDLGVQVTFYPSQISCPNKTIYSLKQELEQLGNQLNLKDYDLVITNTLGGFWGVELANLFKVPSMWYIHESTSIDLFCQSYEKSIQSVILNCFTTAKRIVFVAEATRRLFHSLDIKGNFQVIHGGINLQEINYFRQIYKKSELRRKYGIAEDHIVISIIGTTCERKGQHIFLDALNELKKINPEDFSKITALIVGGRQGKYLELLTQRVQKLNLDNVFIYQETDEVYDFFHLSDIFVCASLEESFPRVILEAMAFELQIISTDVFGIPEMISDGVEGYLVKSGNHQALAIGINNCLRNPKHSAKMARNGYLTVQRKFNAQRLLKKHLETLKKVSLS
ncbi:hypothetical protein C7H19_02450 [Aphanothece hegewaldii CCALA 016]|uniref:Glycosyl transferase family 1 n=1 Tax=Aphanothece hegewaldii CCALA 016 TaxID=2107694 RepID=A0A2T1M2F4_9CHRO|nr:glycosyltransferase [Aphanothece hegewaldii]PSF38935.1 hypothetical protein C7H19_02450 [Aphanothece hegewaldii CCALA 016]